MVLVFVKERKKGRGRERLGLPETVEGYYGACICERQRERERERG